MKKNILFWGAIALQIILLFSIVGKYEYVRLTGETVYVAATGYDPTDLFKGDYVDVRYQLPLPQRYNNLFNESGYGNTWYIVPKVENHIITGIDSISREKPTNNFFFEAKNAWTQSSQKFMIEDAISHKVYSYQQSGFCNNQEENIKETKASQTYKVGEQVLFTIYNETISYIWKYAPGTAPSDTNRVGILREVGNCELTLSLSTSQTSKFYVQEKQGGTLEKKIREGNMFAQWKVGSNGFIILEDIVEKEDIGK